MLCNSAANPVMIKAFSDGDHCLPSCPRHRLYSRGGEDYRKQRGHLAKNVVFTKLCAARSRE